MESEILLRHSPEGLTIPKAELLEEPSVWIARKIDEKRILLAPRERFLQGGRIGEALSRCSVEVFRDFLVGAHNRGWSGVVSVDTNKGIKKVYFAEGEIVFASSNIMDDRLGEVIYREGLISLDQLTDSAVKVDRNNKFGQVLLAGGVFTNQALWSALKLQVKQIFQSLFLVPDVFFQVETSRHKSPTEVVFDEGAIEFIDNAFAFGCQFRAFAERLNDQSRFAVSDSEWARRFPGGTFSGDLIGLIQENPALQDILRVSKLNDLNTLAALMRLVQFGVCEVSGLTDDKNPRFEGQFPAVKSRIDLYSLTLAKAKELFEIESRSFPFSELRSFALELNPPGTINFFLDREANIGRECLNGIILQCMTNPSRAKFFETRVNILVRFLLQVGSDNLPYESSQKLKSYFFGIAS